MTQLQIAVLRAISECGATAYGVPIHRKVNRILKRRKWWNQVSYGAVYVTLDGLAFLGYVQSYTEAMKRPERGGRLRIYWRLTRQGIEALEATA